MSAPDAGRWRLEPIPGCDCTEPWSQEGTAIVWEEGDKEDVCANLHCPTYHPIVPPTQEQP